jgi:hypothetical protein
MRRSLRGRVRPQAIVLEKSAVFSDTLSLGPRRAIVLASDGHAYEIDG